MPQDRSLIVTIRAAVDPLIPDRMVIRLARHPINPRGETESETTTSIRVASRRLELWLTDFGRSDHEITNL